MGKRYVESGNRIPLERLAKYAEEIDKVLQEKQDAMTELELYSLEISSVMDSYNRKSCEKTMMIKGPRKSKQESTNRKTHQENVVNVALRIAEGINQKARQEGNPVLNCKIIEIMAKNHDIGHTFLGHSGEWWLSNIKEDYGIGYYCHNALGPRELIYTNQVYDEITDTIKQSHPEIGEKTLGRIRKNLWLIMEGINSHNGERSESEYRANSTKTEADFKRENLYCHTQKGFDKTIVPATPEASLMRLSDKIAYTPYDMVDGLREGFINGLNEEYRVILKALGITAEEIEECRKTNHYEKIARKLQTVFINDVIENSDASVIRMSKETARLMHKLRDVNNKQIVNFVVLKEDNATYPPALKKFMNDFANIIIEEDLLSQLKTGMISDESRETLLEKYKGTPYEAFIQYTCNTNPADFAYTTQIVEEATRQSISDEQEKAREIVRKREPFFVSADFEMRDKRIKSYIRYYQAKDVSNYSDEEKQKDVESMMQNIKDVGKKNYLYLGMDERIALEMGAKYLTTLNDIEFMELLRETGIVNDTQYQSLTRPYGDINLHDEVYIQENWKAIAAEQEIAGEEK